MMPAMPAPPPRAFLALLSLALLFAGNHIAARVAMDHGVSVSTAAAARSLCTALVVGALVAWQRPALVVNARQWRVLVGLGLLLTVQTLAVYASVARIPVGLALLAFNLYPLCAALWAFAVYGHRPERAVQVAIPVILVGLALALDVAGAASGLGARAQWAQIGAGVGFAVLAAVSFGLVLALTQHEVAALDGRFRSAFTMAIVGVFASAVTVSQGGPHLPYAPSGWWGLAGLCVLYGTAFTCTFVLLPRLGVVGNSPIMSVEPVIALVLGWLLLDQPLRPMQWLGALVVVGAVVGLGLRRRP